MYPLLSFLALILGINQSAGNFSLSGDVSVEVTAPQQSEMLMAASRGDGWAVLVQATKSYMDDLGSADLQEKKLQLAAELERAIELLKQTTFDWPPRLPVLFDQQSDNAEVYEAWLKERAKLGKFGEPKAQPVPIEVIATIQAFCDWLRGKQVQPVKRPSEKLEEGYLTLYYPMDRVGAGDPKDPQVAQNLLLNELDCRDYWRFLVPEDPPIKKGDTPQYVEVTPPPTSSGLPDASSKLSHIHTVFKLQFDSGPPPLIGKGVRAVTLVYLDVPNQGIYRLGVQADDGAVIKLDGGFFMNRSDPSRWGEMVWSPPVLLTVGMHHLAVYVFDRSSPRSLSLALQELKDDGTWSDRAPFRPYFDEKLAERCGWKKRRGSKTGK